MSENKTPGYSLNRPGYGDFADIADLNENADIIDGALQAHAAALEGKADKEAGKGLSQNDYTDAEKAKLAGIASGAQANAVTSVAGKAGAVVLSKSDVGLGNADNTADAAKAVLSATKLATARAINGVAFDGTADISITSGGSAEIRYARLVVGTSAAGHTAAEVDYLCDGAADQIEINAALAALTNGGTVVLREGTYSLAAPVAVSQDGTVLAGSGHKTVLRRAASMANVVVVNAGKRCVLEDLAVDGNRASYASGGGVYVYASAVNAADVRVSMRGVLVKDSAGNGVHVQNDFQNGLQLMSCDISGNGGIGVTGAGVVMSCRLYGNANGASLCYLVTGCEITGVESGGHGTGYGVRTSGSIRIIGNSIRLCDIGVEAPGSIGNIVSGNLIS
jgi:hypothetical protein